MIRSFLSNLDSMPGISRDTVVYYGREHNVGAVDINVDVELKANGILHEYAVHFELAAPETVAFIQGVVSESTTYPGRKKIRYTLAPGTGLALFLLCSFDTVSLYTELSADTVYDPAIF